MELYRLKYYNAFFLFQDVGMSDAALERFMGVAVDLLDTLMQVSGFIRHFYY